MSYDLTPTTEALSQQVNKTPVLVLEIEGSQYIYGSGKILERARWDDPRIQWDNTEGITWDGSIEIDNSRPYISMKDSTKNVSQQLLVEKGGAGSVPSISIALVDYRGEVAKDLAFDQIVEPLGKRAVVSTMLEGGIYPYDASRIFEGYVDGIDYLPGLIKVNITHPSNETRQPLLEKLETRLTQRLRFKVLETIHIEFQQVANLLSTTAEIEIVSQSGQINGEDTAVELTLGNRVTVTFNTNTPVNEEVRVKDIVDIINNSSNVSGYMEARITGDPEALAYTLGVTPMETDTSVQVENANPFTESGDALTSYIRINDEVMEVVSKTDTSFEVLRASRGTTPENHDIEDDVGSAYQLEGLPIDLALKLLLSKPNNEATDSIYPITSINYIDNTQSLDGALIIDNRDIEFNTNLTSGDLVTISSGPNAGTYSIVRFGTINDGRSYIVVDAPLTTEISTNYSWVYRSKWNVLPTGIGLDINQVDVPEMENQASLFSASFIEYDFFLQDTLENVKEFIESELFRPQALYYLPKGSRISCKYTTPPFSIDNLPVLNTSNIEGMSKVISKRALHKYFKNVVVYSYNPDVVEEKNRDKIILTSESSFSRIDRGVKKETIESQGLRRSNQTLQVINTAGLKYLTRFKFGARWLENITVTYQVGMRLQVGDIVFLGGDDTKLVNLETGERDFPLAQYEIINLDHNYAQGVVKISLLETGFSTDGLFGVVSPSSLVSSGSSSDRLLLTDRIFETEDTLRETDKWVNYVGQKVRIVSQDYTRDEVTTLQEIDPQNQDAVKLNPALSFTPQVGDVIELAEVVEYPYGGEADQLRLRYTWSMPSVELTNIISSQIFDVENVDGLEVGMEINVHADDYTRDSETRIIDEINGLELTLNSPLDIAPQIGDRLEVYSYPVDRGYRYL